MDTSQDMLKYYREELKWDPPFAELLSKYSPEALEGYFTMRKSVQDGKLPRKTVELIFTILDSLDNELSGAKAHAVAAIDAGLTVEELVEAFNIVTIVKGINVLCKSGIDAIKAAEERYNEIQPAKGTK
ncbi:carboxymuconolactone decarboxylase family protein [Desulfitobacterium sp. Sab5]|uniref:carboxymuconolactone decarboxylase family protein n=1 Tax=Desulfitobacterium nosdiversum TaxID=3375356 RepID=UPI003CE97909